MGIFGDTYTLLTRELIIFKANLRTNLIRSVIFPIVIIFFFGNISASTFNIGITVVNYANNPQASSFINALTSSKTLQVQQVTSQSSAINMLSQGKTSVVLVILPSFPNKVNGNPSIDIYYSNSNFANIGAAIPLIQSTAQSYNAGISTNILQQQNNNAVLESNVAVVPLYGTSSSYKVFLVGGILAMVAAFGTVFGGGISIIADRQLGVLKSFYIAPINKKTIIFSKMISGVIQSIIYMLVALGIGFIDGATIAMGVLGLVWIILLIMLVAIGFAGVTTVIASRVNKVEVYAILAQVVVLPMWFLSGAFFPATSLPSFIQPFSTLDPMTYATQGIRDVMMLGYYPIQAITTDITALLIFIAFGLIASALLFKNYVD
ncbi:MAG: ABC transporter permease [Candidatus Marsarchaeota archaeon]|nr:ABC transporter permease [Candidatus Marsarchaeota archaeon]